MKFGDEYTSVTRKEQDALLDSKDQTEQDKTVLSNEGYAVGNQLEILNKSMVRLALGR